MNAVKAALVRRGKYLAKLRADAGLTQADLAERLGYSTAQFVSNWERGVSGPPDHIVSDLAEIFGCNRKDLVAELLSPEYAALHAREAALARGKRSVPRTAGGYAS
jgi:transcriptional regulator with XRE-family HTH domain